MSSSRWKVQREDARGRTVDVFDGTERDARKFIAENFPRMHVEPGSATQPYPDATLVGPDGDSECYFGPEYVDESGDYEDGFGPLPETENDDDEDDTPAPAPAPRKRTAAKKTAAKKTAAPSFRGGTQTGSE